MKYVVVLVSMLGGYAAGAFCAWVAWNAGHPVGACFIVVGTAVANGYYLKERES